jgi:hypothetical protein
VTKTDGNDLDATVPAKKATYSLVATTKRTDYTYSPATSTTWTFTSTAPAKGKSSTLPLVQLDYKIATNTAGTATRTAALLVTPAQIAGVSTAAVHTTTVELSYDDGKTWKKASISNSSHGASTHLAAPAKATFVSFRVHATDSLGRTVTQTITRAVGLR